MYINNNPSMSLYAWQLFIQELVAKHGPNAILSTGGANNSLTIEQPKSAFPKEALAEVAKRFR